MDNSSVNPNIHTIVKAQVVFLLSTLTEDNFERNQLEIRSLSEQHGVDMYLHFIRRLIVHAHSKLSTTPTPINNDPGVMLTFRLLVQEVQRLARDPFLADRFRDGIDKGEGDVFRHFDLVRFVERVGLQPLERLVLASSIVAGQTRKELQMQAASIIRADFESAVLAICQHPSFDHADLSPNQVAKLLANLLSEPPEDAPILDATQRQALIAAAHAKYGSEIVVPILQRILPHMSLPPETTLVQALVQMGADVTSDPEVIRALLVRYGISDKDPPTDKQVVEIIESLARLASEGAALPDVGSLVRALSSFGGNIQWANAIKVFDMPERHGVDTATLKLLIAILLNAPREADPHAVTGFWQIWNNSMYQLRLLDALLSLPADTFNFVSLPGHRIVTVDDVNTASPTVKSLAANVQGHTWNSLDLFEVLVRLADADSPGLRNFVRDMLDKAVKISAELVHLGLLQAPYANWGEIRLAYTQRLLSMFLAGHPNHQLVFTRIWQIEPTYLTNALREYYDESPQNITRILDVAQDLKILDTLLEVRPFTFALDVAALASRREYLNLDKWLADNVATHGAEFLHAVIEFLEIKMEDEKATRITDPAVEHRTLQLSPQTITIFLRVLRNNSNIMHESDIDYCLQIRNACLQIHPRLMNLVPGSDAEPGFTVITYPPDIEAEVDAIYRQMYEDQISIDDVIVLLQRNKASNNPRDHEIFSCMLHFLFDEYKFFQSYPPRELAMTAYLLGSIIQCELVDYIPLGIAIRYVLDALKCPPETNLFKFGLQALSRFEGRLHQWRPLCNALLDIPALLEVRPELGIIIRRALAAGAENGDSSAEFRASGPVPALEPPPIFNAVQADRIDEEPECPSEEVSDKILFIVNNLAPSNFDSKLTEMREHFKEPFARWFANYLVDQRVSTEPNNHQLYLNFLDALDVQALFRFVLHETYIKSAALLNSEKTMQSTSERTVLKNVASWLGKITLARDRPIRHKNLSLKDLLIEGYDNGRLIVAVPFVCKTLEPCAKSKVFKPPNPWLMAVISLLAELYRYAEMKSLLKFEIELLCKALDINLDAIQPTTILRNRPLTNTLTGSGLPEYVGDIDGLPMRGFDHMGQAPGESFPLINPASPSEPQRVLGTHIENILQSLLPHVIIHPQLAPLHTNQTFKRAVQMAIDRSVREIIVPVVERSVTIAGISTRELVAKDFAMEPSEEKMRKAGHLMAQKLAGSLALVTCRDPLKTNLVGHIRTFLNECGFNEQLVPEPVVQLLVQDNLELACQVIEKAAMDRAIVDVDDGFAAAYEVRRRHRETHPGQPFYDPSAPTHPLATQFPEPLRIKPAGIQQIQAVVYEDFGADPKRRVLTSRPSSTVSYPRSDLLASASLYAPSPAPEQAVPGQTFLRHPDAMERFNAMVKDLEALLLQLPVQSLAALPPTHEIRLLVRQILYLANESIDRQRTPLLMSQKIVQLLYKTSSPLGREIYVALLDQLCRIFEDVAKEAITWLIYAEDERKFNVPVTVTLLRSRLISIEQEDQQLAKFLIANSRPTLLTFAAELIRECLSIDPPIATQSQFAYTLEVLNTLSQSGKANDEVHRLLDDLHGVRRPSAQASLEDQLVRQPSVKPETEQLREKLFYWFQQWVSIFRGSHTPEKSFIPFITQLTKQGILKVEDVSSFFFRVCAESSVNSYIKCVNAGEYGLAFQALDAMSRLIVYIIKYHGDAAGVNNDQAKVHYLTKILSIFVLVLANMHEEQGAMFQQKPFFRFFCSLLHDLHANASSLETAYFPLLLALSDTFSSLQPTYFPGFAFSWMSLISHRLFMPKLLLSENRERWSAFYKLLISLFKFLSPFLKAADLQQASRDLYRGSLRILLVLLHDFPEFLSEYYFSLCDVIPARCIQLRNVILSAFPPGVMLPDPHLRSIDIDSITETGPIPAILSDITSGLKPGDLQGYLDQYLLNRGSPSVLSSLKDRLRMTGVSDSSESYNLSLINSLVMYIGVSSVAQAKTRSGSALFVSTDPGVVALQYLATNVDAEGQHHLLSAMLLHLRYPNAHTHWFSSVMLHLFLEIKSEQFREVMTKVLLERFLVHRPHPWGALVTFIELLRNPKYDFWSQECIRSVPEVTILFEQVARSVLQS